MIDSSQMLGVILKSLAVIATIVPALWLLHRLGEGFGQPRRRHMRVLETQSLGAGQTLYLLRVGDEHLLLAGGKNGVSFLSTIRDLPVAEEERIEQIAVKGAGDGATTRRHSWGQRLEALRSGLRTCAAARAQTERD